jgi:hypothetical protein
MPTSSPARATTEATVAEPPQAARRCLGRFGLDPPEELDESQVAAVERRATGEQLEQQDPEGAGVGPGVEPTLDALGSEPFGTHVGRRAEEAVDRFQGEPRPRQALRVERLGDAEVDDLGHQPAALLDHENVRGFQVRWRIWCRWACSTPAQTRMKTEVVFVNGRARPANFDEFTPLTLDETPEIETHLIDGDDPRPPRPGGADRLPLAPAVATALSRLAGHRVRRLPGDRSGPDPEGLERLRPA